MAIICKVCGLKKTSNTKQTFHRLPSNRAVAQLWCEALHLNIENLKKSAVICSDHFLPHHICRIGCRTTISKTALPVIKFHGESSSEISGLQSPAVLKNVEIDSSATIYEVEDFEASSSSTLTAPEVSMEVLSSSSTMTASEALLEIQNRRRKVFPRKRFQTSKILDSVSNSENISLKSNHSSITEERNRTTPSSNLRTPEVFMEDFSSSSTITAPETLMEFQNYRREIFPKKRFWTSRISTLDLPSQITPKKRKAEWDENQLKKRGIRYFGDCETDDMDTDDTRRRRECFKVAKRTIIRQRQKIKQLQQRNRRMKSKINTLKDLTNLLKEQNRISESAESSLNASLTGTAKELFNRMLKKPGKYKYSPELRQFALTLNFYSTKSYNYVRNTFLKSLPHVRTLSKWYQTVDCSPGFLKEALTALKMKVADAKLKRFEILCNLVFDEMAIRKRIEWDGDKFHGYVDFGTNLDSDQLEEAKEALVFMVVAMNGSWKIPVGYFFVNGLCANEKVNLICNCLKFIHECGIIITSVTFDGTSTNLAVAKQLGASLTPSNLKTFFIHPETNEKIYVFLDPSHMLKLIRNCFGSLRVLHTREIKDKKIIQGKPIKWEFIERLCSIQEKEGLHSSTKLKRRHIFWLREKMKVKLAAQTLSNSVADALDFLNLDLKLKEFMFSESTSMFCRTFNKLFDIFNSRSRFTKKPFEKPLSPATKETYFDFMDECIDYIEKLTTNDMVPILYSKRKTGFLGFLICINSLKQMYEERVLEKKQLKYILTYKLSQDHLEIFFSCVRSKGGHNNNPTARQFTGTMKRLLIHSEIQGNKSANAVALDSTNILHCSSSSITKKVSDEIEKDITPWANETNNHDYSNSSVWASTLYTDDVVAYIAGFVIRKIKKKVSCDICLKLLECGHTISKLQKRKSYGIMSRASEFVVDICKEGEKCLRVFKSDTQAFLLGGTNLLNRLILKTLKNLRSNIFDIFEDHIFDEEPLSNHGYQISKLILQKYFEIRIHHETSILENSRGKRMRSVLTKAILFRNQ